MIGSKWPLRAVAATIAAVAVSSVAIGAQPGPRAGLWNQTLIMDLSGMGMPQMPQMTPEMLAQMQAAGVQMPNMDYSQPRTTTSQYCVTPEESANMSAPDLENDDCVQENLQVTATGMSLDLVCTGDMNGTGRIEYVFDSDTHYMGTMTFAGTMDGRPANMNNTMEGNWASADCGNVAP
jgi:hypothetical protein